MGSLMELSDSSWHFSAERERETKPKLDQAKPYMHMMALSDSSWYLVECVAIVFACVRRCKSRTAHVHRICVCVQVVF